MPMAVRVYLPPVVEPPEFAAILLEVLVVVLVEFKECLVVALEGVGEALDGSGIAHCKG